MIATPRPLPDSFFDRDAQVLARALLGKIIRHRHQQEHFLISDRNIIYLIYFLGGGTFPLNSPVSGEA